MKFLVLKLIRFYQKALSPGLHYLNPNCGCRFYPTCSEYTFRAVGKFGFIKGIIKGVKRIIRCHPFNQGGHDPV